MKTDEEISRPAIVADDDEEEDPELCAKEKFILRSFVLEFKFLEDLVEEAVKNGGIVELATVKKAQAILDKYQEQGQLLEPHLESLISPLMSIVREKTSEMGKEVLEVIKPICMFLYGLVTVCGYKTVTRFFPHHVSDLEPAVMLLRRCHADLRSTASTAVRQESTGEWETKCIVILWLSILVLVPFDMSSVDTALALTDDHADTATPPLVQIMISICQHYLSNPGPMRKMSGVLLSRLLTRPDMKPTLTRFMQWTHDMLVAPEDGIANEFLIPGIAEAMAAIFKVGGRDVLLNVASVAWLDTCALARSTFATRSPLLRKLIVKLTQRVGLTYLPPRANSWRYVGQSSFLRQNLISTSKSNSNIEQVLESTIDNANKYLDDDEEIDVPDIIEEVIEQLLTGLKDKDTVVRWSAAKGIGRVTNRLTSSLADEVLGSTLDLFSPGEGDGSWHGGCLALAELSRRGLLLPVRLPEVVPVIIKALHYDVRRGPHSIGSHVRDAAAYVCWAFARAYSHSVMKSILNEVAPHLLTIACYDREVNCRRAAAAAFQENVGRQGTFPNGISIVNAADYFSLATRNNSYLNVAVYIAQYNNYLHFFIEELLQSKIQHWEKSLRELSAVALAHLVKYNSLYFEEIVLEKLIPGTLSADLNLRHGSTLAVAEVVLALHQHGHELPSEKQKAVANIVPAIEKARLYRGKGGEIMRVSVSRLIECTSTAKIKLPPKVQKTLLDTLNENLRHPNAQIQACAVEALKQYTQVYINPAEASFISGLTSKYIETLRSDPNVAAKRGAALALSVLPYEIVVQNWKTILTSLCCACLIPENPDERDAETRVNSVRGLKAICHTLVKGAKEFSEPIIINRHNVLKFMKDEVMNCLFTALDDYSVDNRGDVGSWVREAAMEALEQCTFLFCQVFSNAKEQGEETALSLLKDNLSEQVQKDEEFIDKAVVGRLIGLVAKQAVEKIDKVRQIAGRTLQRIIHNEDIFVPFIPHRYELERIMPKESSINWASSSASFSCLVHLLQLPEYRQFIMSGLVISIGGLAESVSKTSLNALLDYLHAPNNETEIDKEKVKILSSQLCEVLQCYRKKDRVIVPTIKTIELLFDKGIFFNLEEQEEDFSSRIVESLAVELKGSKDVTKLISGINILEHVCAMQKNNHTRTLSLLLSFLCHPYPKVRKACADQVYIFFLQCGEGVFDTNILNQLVDIVGETCWDHHKEEATSQMKKLYSLLNLDSPFVKASNKSTQRLSECKVSKRDENESYSSLVDSSGF